MQVNLDTRKLTSFALVAFIAGGALGGILWNMGGVYVPNSVLGQTFGNMKHFTSYDDLKEYLTEHSSGPYRILGRGFGLPLVMYESVASGGNAVPYLAPSGQSTGDSIDFSSTNIQVEGVDEADTVKTDGSYIYYTRGNEVIILRAYPAEDAGIVSRITLENRVSDLYLSEDKLVVFSSSDTYYSHYVINSDTEHGPQTLLTIYNISDRNNPEKIRELGMDGEYFNSRLIGDYLYYIITNPAYVYDDIVNLPGVRENNTWCTIEPEQIWYPNNTRNWMEYYTVSGLNIQNPEAKITSETFLLDSGSTIYVSPTNLYLTTQDWSSETTITKIGIENGAIIFKANGTVPGYVLNQFSMDEYNGYFRIATTDQNWRSGDAGNNVFVLDENLNIVGSLEKLAPGEEIYSARFMGNRCYLVTFQKVDPLFAIDLSNPENPTVLGKLKIPGYSDYLHPYDENTLIGIGKETVEAEGGDFSWYQGVKISLFDVSDVQNPRELAKIEIGNRGTDSPALYDHHAFLFSKAKNLLVIPILEATIDENDFSGSVPDNYYGEYTYQGAYVFHISPDGIELQGRITHLDNSTDLLKSGYWFNSEYEVERSLYIENDLYTLSQGMIKINSLDTLNELAAINLGE
jgi:inhibitor of cysteine peptidase